MRKNLNYVISSTFLPIFLCFYLSYHADSRLDLRHIFLINGKHRQIFTCNHGIRGNKQQMFRIRKQDKMLSKIIRFLSSYFGVQIMTTSSGGRASSMGAVDHGVYHSDPKFLDR